MLLCTAADRLHRSVPTELFEGAMFLDQPIPPSLVTKETPSSLTDQGLTWDRVPGGATIGFYVGSASSFDDLVNFWNLRASGVNAMFLDPDHSDRLALLRDDSSAQQRQRSTRSEKGKARGCWRGC
jgi:hypothetical protein